MKKLKQQIQVLGACGVCTSVRDDMVWPSEDGATFQGTAIGEGLMAVSSFTRRMATLAPGVPLFVESISNSQRPIPFLTSAFRKGYPNLHASDLVDIPKLCRRGRPIEIFRPVAGMDARTFERQHQRREFERSIGCLRPPLQRRHQTETRLTEACRLHQFDGTRHALL